MTVWAELHVYQVGSTWIWQPPPPQNMWCRRPQKAGGSGNILHARCLLALYTALNRLANIRKLDIHIEKWLLGISQRHRAVWAGMHNHVWNWSIYVITFRLNVYWCLWLPRIGYFIDHDVIKSTYQPLISYDTGQLSWSGIRVGHWHRYQKIKPTKFLLRVIFSE